MPELSSENLEKQIAPEKEEATLLLEKELIEETIEKAIKKPGMTEKKWFEENAESFGENFRETINKNPELLNLYKKDPEKAKQEFRKRSIIH